MARATLYSPTTGQREAIEIGSPRERTLFSEGYKLETPTQNYQASQPDRTLSSASPTTPPRDINQSYNDAIAQLLNSAKQGSVDEDLYKRKSELVNQRFNVTADVTPEELQILTPTQQAALRNQKRSGVQTELGATEAAIKAREAARSEARTFAMDMLSYAQKVSESEKPQIFGSADAGYYTLNTKGEVTKLVDAKDTTDIGGGMTGNQLFNNALSLMNSDPINYPDIQTAMTGVTNMLGGGSGEGGMRTDRHNNPTAMTTDVAKSLGLKEGVDYTVGDPFQSGDSTLYTARLNGDGITTTVKALDSAANDPKKQAFYTQSGDQRWTYIGMSDSDWLKMTPDEKKQTVLGMYQQEGGQGKFGGSVSGGGQPSVPSFDQFISQKEQEAGMSFNDSRKNALRPEYNRLYGTTQSQTDDGNELLKQTQRIMAKSSSANRTAAVNNVRGYISSGDIQSAQSAVDTYAYNSLGQTEKETFNQNENAIAGLQVAQSLLNDPELQIGPWKQLFENAKPWLLMSTDPKYNQLRVLVDMNQAQLRRAFFGTAVTDSEQKSAAGFLIQPTDDMNRIKIKLEYLPKIMQFANDAKLANVKGSSAPKINNYVGDVVLPSSNSSSKNDYQSYLNAIR
jgi:hypothetical protein